MCFKNREHALWLVIFFQPLLEPAVKLFFFWQVLGNWCFLESSWYWQRIMFAYSIEVLILGIWVSDAIERWFSTAVTVLVTC